MRESSASGIHSRHRGGDDRTTEHFNDEMRHLDHTVEDGEAATFEAERMEMDELKRMLGAQGSDQLAKIRLAFDSFDQDGQGYSRAEDTCRVFQSIGCVSSICAVEYFAIAWSQHHTGPHVT